MKLYDVYVEQIDLHEQNTRAKNYQVIGTDLQQAIFCAGQVFHENTLWYTLKLSVTSVDKKESYETEFEGWKS